jgi:hypothetical protein
MSMPQPDLDLIWSSWGTNSSESFAQAGIVSTAANMAIGTNPAYGPTDFLSVYPKFTTVIPDVVLAMYIALASACLSRARWCEQWNFGMALFIAHYCTLYLQSEGQPGSTAGQVAASGLAKGIAVSQSVGDVSVSYEPVTSGFESWGAWQSTTYGTQLIAIAKIVGWGILVIY